MGYAMFVFISGFSHILEKILFGCLCFIGILIFIICGVMFNILFSLIFLLASFQFKFQFPFLIAIFIVSFVISAIIDSLAYKDLKIDRKNGKLSCGKECHDLKEFEMVRLKPDGEIFIVSLCGKESSEYEIVKVNDESGIRTHCQELAAFLGFEFEDAITDEKS
jgi:hypothetical protein